jgi:hypothetical protein
MSSLDIYNSRLGFVTAPAGHGKTYSIVESIKSHGGAGDKQLILTHTQAGVAVLKKKLAQEDVPSSHFTVVTIAGWCLKYVQNYHLESGYEGADMPMGGEWNKVYIAMEKLLLNPSVRAVIVSSYGGLFVDEYQDCGIAQHTVVLALSEIIKCRIFGDPLQSIFNFRGQPLVDWRMDVEGHFTNVTSLDIPQRWIIAGNAELGRWIADCRRTLLIDGTIDLTSAPASVTHVTMTGDSQADVQSLVMKSKLRIGENEKIAIIGDKTNQRAKNYALKRISNPHFYLVEAMESKELNDLACYIDETKADSGMRLHKLLKECMTNIPSTVKSTADKLENGDTCRPTSEIGKRLVKVHELFDPLDALWLVAHLKQHNDVILKRPQPIQCLIDTFEMMIGKPEMSMQEALRSSVEVIRHRGRYTPKRTIGSTLLLKGLEFDHVIIYEADSLSRNDLYVAISRATKSLTIFSKQQRITTTSGV